MVGPGQWLVDVAVGMPIDDPGQDVGEIGKPVDVVELAGLDQGREDGPVFGTAVGSSKQRVLATELVKPARWLNSRSALSSEPRESGGGTTLTSLEHAPKTIVYRLAGRSHPSCDPSWGLQVRGRHHPGRQLPASQEAPFRHSAEGRNGA